jgi:hypothetical protein
MSPAELAATEPALIDFDSLVTAADPLRASLHIIQHDLSAELGPVRDGMWTEMMFEVDSGGRYAPHDVVREEKNLDEMEVTPRKP